MKKGELDPHYWNEAIGSRLRRSEPQILAIDSLEPVVSLDLNRSLTHSEQMSVWRHLPVRPSKLNQKGEVLVVCGDILYRTPKAAGRILGFEADKQEKLSNLLNKKDDSATSDLRTDIQMETGAPLILSLMLAIGAGASIGRLNNIEQKSISRRNILKGITGLGAAGAASVLAGKGSIYGASLATNEKLANFFEKVADIAQPIFTSQTAVNGRTALLISKSIEAQNLGLTPDGTHGAVVLGNGHAYKSEELMKSKDKRVNAIASYYKDFTLFFHEVCEKFPEIPEKDFMDYLARIFPSFDLISVTDSGEDKTDDVKKFMDEHVKYAGTFMSSEVQEAIDKVDQKPSDQVKVF